MDFFTKQYIAIASVITIVSTLVFQLAMPERMCLVEYFVPAIFSVVSVLLIKVLIKPKFEKIAKFSNAFMISNMVKMVVYLVLLLAVVFNIASEKRIPFAIFFMLNYLVYAVADTITLLNLFRRKDNKSDAD